MLIKLTGPREGQTVELCKIQFVDGFAEVNELPIILERYHGVVEYKNEIDKDFPKITPDLIERESEEVPIQEEVKELNDTVQSIKQELSKERIKTQKDFSSFGEFKAYVGKLTGTSPRGGKQAVELLTQYAQEHNIEFEVE